ncbi:serine/threonine-protein kinase [Paraburkholderia aromaticivorans]|uniref:non-specific serine/threonine protein kinase n=1 Tax=Paraburkholderia aromaticivorans TaxID=2026199 RepID=A0A248VWZ9_9BURK|nr:serine/threonine-protein kinase [Paraburkholderia aromaticivorans]ASW03518.1 serine/threonine protein kinase [Paraburkholderia aromaticivorans]
MIARTEVLPRQVGRYQVERVLGRGAMSTVYLATDPHIQRQVALKTIRAELLNDAHGTAADAELPARFINEARAAGRLVHPHIVSVFDYGEADGVAFIALEYVRGETLAARLAQHAASGTAMPLIRVLVWFAQLLDALAYAHDVGVIHRDIKPANLLIAPRGECKITDFGIAQLDTGRLTQVGMMIGTPSYMSPEQYAGAQIDARSDLFSAGVVLYEMLTGMCPFSGASAVVMQQVMNEMPPAPSSRAAALPPEVDAMVLKALAKQPAQRYESAQGWRVELLALLDTLTARIDPDQTVVVTPLVREGLAPPANATAAHAAPLAWPPELLAQLERRLASHVGPVASRLVRRAAAQAADSHTLAAQLARHLPDDAARQEFTTLLARHATSSGIVTPHAARLESGARQTGAAIDPARVELAARRLATHIGPIARIVAQRAALGADIAAFHARLADALPASVDKRAFLDTLDTPNAPDN